MKVFISILLALFLVGIYVTAIVFVPWLFALIIIVLLIVALARIIYRIL